MTINNNFTIERLARANGQLSSTLALWLEGDPNKIINSRSIMTLGTQREIAVEFNGNDNMMELWSTFLFTATFTGVTHTVVANCTNNHLVLGGANDGAFNLSDIGAGGTNSLSRSFADYKKTGTSLYGTGG